VGGFVSSSYTIMSTVSAGGESSVTTMTARGLKKYVELFGVRLLSMPSGPVSSSNAPEVRRWVELARIEVVRIASFVVDRC
jgi:hypothetical protein